MAPILTPLEHSIQYDKISIMLTARIYKHLTGLLGILVSIIWIRILTRGWVSKATLVPSGNRNKNLNQKWKADMTNYLFDIYSELTHKKCWSVLNIFICLYQTCRLRESRVNAWIWRCKVINDVEANILYTSESMHITGILQHLIF